MYNFFPSPEMDNDMDVDLPVQGAGATADTVHPPMNPAVQQTVASDNTVHAPMDQSDHCLLYTSPSPRDGLLSRMPSSA